MISNCGHDEHGKYSGGAAGDQTGTEWELRKYYGTWDYVLRHPDPKVRECISDLHTKAAKNDNVGYDQSQRLTYWACLVEANYDPSKINKKCEADCSSGVAANVKATGYILGIEALKKVSTSMYTGNELKTLKAAGFEVLKDAKYLTSDAYLLPGDILLREGHHTAVNVSTGSKVKKGSCYMFEVDTVKKGTIGASTLLCQKLLKANDFRGQNGRELALDGECGNNTVYAINAYQTQRRKAGVELGTKGANDGTCGPAMWEDLLGV